MHSFKFTRVLALSVLKKTRECFIAGGVHRPSLFSVKTNPFYSGAVSLYRTLHNTDRADMINHLSKKPLPVILPMLNHLYVSCWVPGTWSNPDSIDRRGLYLINDLGTALGVRTSNLVQGDLIRKRGKKIRNDHWLRDTDMNFTVLSPSSDVSSVLPSRTIVSGGGRSLRIALSLADDVSLDAMLPEILLRVADVSIRLLTSKGSSRSTNITSSQLAAATPSSCYCASWSNRLAPARLPRPFQLGTQHAIRHSLLRTMPSFVLHS